MFYPGVSVVKNLPANVRDAGDIGLNPGSERSLGEGNGNPFQYSCLKNPMEEEPARGGRLQSIGSQKRQTRLNNWACTHVTLESGEPRKIT